MKRLDISKDQSKAERSKSSRLITWSLKESPMQLAEYKTGTKSRIDVNHFDKEC